MVILPDLYLRPRKILLPVFGIAALFCGGWYALGMTQATPDMPADISGGPSHADASKAPVEKSLPHLDYSVLSPRGMAGAEIRLAKSLVASQKKGVKSPEWNEAERLLGLAASRALSHGQSALAAEALRENALMVVRNAQKISSADVQSALKLAIRARDLDSSVGATRGLFYDHVAIAKINNWPRADRSRKDLERADAEFRTAMELAKELPGLDIADLASARLNLINNMQTLSRDYVACYRAFEEIARSPEYPVGSKAEAFFRMGDNRLHLARYDESVDDLNESLRLFNRLQEQWDYWQGVSVDERIARVKLHLQYSQLHRIEDAVEVSVQRRLSEADLRILNEILQAVEQTDIEAARKSQLTWWNYLFLSLETKRLSGSLNEQDRRLIDELYASPALDKSPEIKFLTYYALTLMDPSLAPESRNKLAAEVFEVAHDNPELIALPFFQSRCQLIAKTASAFPDSCNPARK